jgi:endo-beta-N-acetylglucosaminidase D
MKYYEGRQTDLKNRINKHLKKLTGKEYDYYSAMTQNDLVELKTVLADINNVLTFKTTLSAANWLCKYFGLDKNTEQNIIETVDKTKPNTKGYDIIITEPYKIIAEVKCISPVNNGGKFGAAQWNSILDDCYKLKNGKGLVADTSKYYKFLFLLDLGGRTDLAITQLLRISKGTSDKLLRANRHKIKEHVVLLSAIDTLKDIGFDKVYLKKIEIDKESVQ